MHYIAWTWNTDDGSLSKFNYIFQFKVWKRSADCICIAIILYGEWTFLWNNEKERKRSDRKGLTGVLKRWKVRCSAGMRSYMLFWISRSTLIKRQTERPSIRKIQTVDQNWSWVELNTLQMSWSVWFSLVDFGPAEISEAKKIQIIRYISMCFSKCDI